MDYNNEAMYGSSLICPSNPDVTAKYPGAWQGESQLNVVMWVEHCTHGMTYLCKGRREVGERRVLPAFNRGDRLGFLLDMDKGTLALYRNGNLDGEIASGLTGEYVWVVNSFLRDEGTVKICEWE